MTHLQERLCEFFLTLSFSEGKKEHSTIHSWWTHGKNKKLCPHLSNIGFFFLLDHFLFSCNIKSIFCIVLYNFVRLWYFLSADLFFIFYVYDDLFLSVYSLNYFPVKMLEPLWQKQYCGHWLVIITVVIMIISSCSSSSSAPTDEWLFSVSFILYLKARFCQTNEQSNLN